MLIWSHSPQDYLFSATSIGWDVKDVPPYYNELLAYNGKKELKRKFAVRCVDKPKSEINKTKEATVKP